MKEKPNIILFITHDQGQFLGCYDSPQTPNSLNTLNLDKIAENGVKFTNYFCTAPQCSPSRGSIITSKYPHQNGLMGLVNRGWNLPEENKTLPGYLKENGYTTHLIGLQHETWDPPALGYDMVSKRFFSKTVEISPMYNCELIEKECLKFFNEHKNDKKSFFVSIGLFEVHRPFRSTKDPVDSKFVKIPPFLPDNEIIRKELAQYYGAINQVDITIGKLMTLLEETGLKENTLFIFTTDHGSPFPRAKCTLYDPGIKTILIMHWPRSEIFSGGKTVDCLLSNIDLLPTLLDLIEAKIPDDIEGKSFQSILKGKDKEMRKEIFVEKTFHELYDPIRGIRTSSFKYIKNFEKLDTLYQIPVDILMAPSGKYMEKSYNKPRKGEELYDLINDPNEKTNLIDNPNYQNIVQELKNKLNDWMIRTKDPLLKGKIEPQSQVQFRYKRV